MRDTDKEVETSKIREYLLDEFKQFKLKYYSKEFTGDQIIDSLTDEQINKLDGDVLYIGEESDETFKKLRNAGKVTQAYSL